VVNLGTRKPGSTVYIPFESFAASTGAPITLTGLAVGDILIYKNGGTTERASTAGYTLLDTDGIDFDSKTGIHGVSLNLADNTTAGFWAAGSNYIVVISDVTVDAVTMRFIAAAFDIGYSAAILDTTIATLASQTSFTLTDGPAEDDAINGCAAIIHDVASAVQTARVVVLDYTGATKTVTLAAGGTFTAAATDNISIMYPQPIQPTVTGRTLDVTATGGAGVDWANVESPTTTLALTGTTISTTQKVDVETIKTNAVVNAGTITFPTTATLASTTNITAGTITTATTVTNQLTAAAIAAGVWRNAVAADFTVASSIGKAMYIDNIAPGSNGGFFISGSNAGTTTLGALTVTGATTLTGVATSTNASNDLRINGLVPGAAGGVFVAGTNAATTITTGLTTTFTGSLTGSVASVSGSVASVTGLTASDVGAIKTKTDQLTFTVANQVNANALSISGDGVAADNLELAYENGLPFLFGQVHVGAATTTTTFETDTAAIISRADDFMNSGLITFVSGALQGMTFRIADWVTATNVFTLTTMPTAPANDDWFIIIGRQTS